MDTQEQAIQAKHEPLNRINFRLYPTDKQKLTSALPSDLSFTFKHLVTRLIEGEISLHYLAEYPQRPKQNKELLQVQPVIGPQLKLEFEAFCNGFGMTTAHIARGLAYAIIDRKITLEFNMDEEVKK